MSKYKIKKYGEGGEVKPQPLVFDSSTEAAYRSWINSLPANHRNSINDDYNGVDYDYRRMYAEQGAVNPAENGHFTDRYKLPNHPTFSNESMYFNALNQHNAGRWSETDSSWKYNPYNENFKQPIVEEKFKNGGEVMSNKYSVNPKKYNTGGTIGGLVGTGLSLIPGAQPFAPLIVGASTMLGEGIYNTMNPEMTPTEPSQKQNVMNPYGVIMREGGTAVPNAEIEGGEMVQMPDGRMMDAQGPSHEQGGIKINLPDGAFVFPVHMRREVEDAKGNNFKLATLKQKVLQMKRDSEAEAKVNAEGQPTFDDGGTFKRGIANATNPRTYRIPTSSDIIDRDPLAPITYGENVAPYIDPIAGSLYNNQAGVPNNTSSFPVASQQQSGSYSNDVPIAPVDSSVGVLDPVTGMYKRSLGKGADGEERFSYTNPNVISPGTGKQMTQEELNKAYPSASPNAGTGNEGNGYGSTAMRIAQYAPTIYNAVKSFQEPKKPILRQSSLQPANDVKNLQYNIEPQLQEANRIAATEREYIGDNTANRGVANALRQSTVAGQYRNANSLYAQKNNEENRYKMTGSAMEDATNKYNTQLQVMNDDTYAQNVAQQQRFGAAAVEGLSNITTTLERDAKQYGMQKQYMDTLKTIYPAMQHRTYSELLDAWNKSNGDLKAMNTILTK